jgi:flagellar basal-body rod modification protein FlgD
MSTTNPISVPPAPQPKSTNSALNPATSTDQSFGKDAFMKLLVEQLRNQSPDNASDPNAFMNQMTQFSILEQLQNQSKVQAQQSAAGLLGHTVSYQDDDGKAVDGTVDAVDYTGGNPTLTIAGKDGIDPAKVFNVR